MGFACPAVAPYELQSLKVFQESVAISLSIYGFSNTAARLHLIRFRRPCATVLSEYSGVAGATKTFFGVRVL